MKFPKIPKGPITLALNGIITDIVLNQFVDQYLPAYDVHVTSGYRTPDQNAEAGGAEWSAHLYNLARDFALKLKITGQLLSADQQQKIYKEFIAPNWIGYHSYNPPKDGKTGWIHVGLDRNITLKTQYAEWAIGGFTFVLGIKKIISQLKKEGRNV